MRHDQQGPTALGDRFEDREQDPDVADRGIGDQDEGVLELGRARAGLLTKEGVT